MGPDHDTGDRLCDDLVSLSFEVDTVGGSPFSSDNLPEAVDHAVVVFGTRDRLSNLKLHASFDLDRRE